ncbi:MAG: UDP-glucose/GDP-mannose dehydrogenase family protein [Bacteroidetes bacterium]|nr:UDP-glucose/GDP-mannose dehydrogenase family protein [Rhodothermia bacterium]MCX7906852.1 UDP-glucose/GDP-mannose dehydrogenase family protein [Bacteroidota bacterium]MDW8285261.1 UDP-glucose/GDP-mannose dehydrogenase family protein [Bacteroidota bacterium]
MKLAIVGTGYVGLVTGVCFADSGHEVICVDVDAEKIRRLTAGQIPIFEPGLEVLFERSRREGRLHFTTDLAEAVSRSDVVFLALPTPPDADGAADLRYVLEVADQIGPLVDRYKLIVTKSTVPVGTAELVRERIGRKARAEFDVASNPEFLREGAAVEDFLKPERVIVGASSPRAIEILRQLYEPFVRQGNPILVMDERSAELTKYAANAFLAMRISFMNEIALICERVGANVDWVRRGIGTDSRIGPRFLFPGVGYGGSCFPKDVKALIQMARAHGYEFRILKAVDEVNRRQREYFLQRILDYLGADLKGRTLAIWGLAFKPNTDDIREAPALYFLDRLLEAGASLRVYDPEAMRNVRALYGDRLYYARHLYDAVEGAEALLILTEWNEFRRPDLERVRALLSRPVIFDGRNVYDPEAMRALGFTYFSIGRPTVLQQTPVSES